MRSSRHTQKYREDSDSDVEKDYKFSAHHSDDEDILFDNSPTVRKRSAAPNAKDYRGRNRSESEAKGEIEDKRDLLPSEVEVADCPQGVKFREPKGPFKPKHNALTKSSSSWAEKKPSLSNVDNDKENDDFRRSSWNAATPTTKEPVQNGFTKTRDIRHPVYEPSENSELVEESSGRKSVEEKFEDPPSRSGEILARKSGRYDFVSSDDADSPTSMESSSSSSAAKISFVMKAHVRGAKSEHVQCTIVRDRSSIQSKMYPTYELFLDDNKKKLVIATKMNLNRTSNYHLFDMTRGVAGSKLSKKSGNYLGKLRARNLNRTEYVLVSQSSEREELAGIAFDRLGIMNHLKDGSQPRKMTIIVPHLDSNKVPIPNAAREDGGGSVLDMLASETRDNRMLMFESKDPVFENGNYRLNFKGRVSVPSVKNFQLVAPDEIENVICQFGKIGEDRFHLDFKAPLNAFQAFALALCQFNL